jgi:hypothetical protein
METGALLEKFNERLKEIERLQALIHKAKSQASKFSAAVVEKVVKDNTAKTHEVATSLEPLASELENLAATLRGKRDGVIMGSQEAKFALQEIELRHLIGEYEDGEYEDRAEAPRTQVEAAEAQVAELEGQVASLESALGDWGRVHELAGL